MNPFQKTILTTLLILSIFHPVSALAIATDSAVANPIRTQIQENRQEMIETIQQNRQEIQENRASAATQNKILINQLRLQVMQKIQNQIRQKLENRYQTLLKIQTILQDRIQQQSQAGVDVSSIQIEIDKADQYQGSYQTQIEIYNQTVVSMNQSDTPVQFRNQLSQQARLTNQELIQYTQTLRQVLNLLINL